MAADRRVGVAVDFSPSSKNALKWAVDNIMRKGDYLILVAVQPEGHYEEGEMQLWAISGGSPLIPLSEFSDPATMKKYGLKPDPETLDIANTAAKQKEVMVVMKIYWGDPREKLCEAIDSIPLSCMVVGNRGLGTLKRAIMGSVSNYVVNNGSCPVTVVKHHGHD
ncbi:hypothetical protein ES332_D09G082800v1 [Gossypium tomentosum]|uniref:UspA domain-containing protein n=1 Tax=Gossypium tomentosum TaxID=34277 RepID=A0A5D2JE64_GOSTO|nr:hypothetical protein ES332_D09G082800v1 [Gossypium tomentosum]